MPEEAAFCYTCREKCGLDRSSEGRIAHKSPHLPSGVLKKNSETFLRFPIVKASSI
jgi:hypothetical protein